MAGAVQHAYRYPFTSAFVSGGAAPQVRLATSGGTAPHPFFFQGSLEQPRLTAHLLRVLAKVVGARFHVPAAMLARILRECDPVVTSGGGLLRFEGFSACGSTYARVDLNPDAYTGVVIAHGTTNVDFNPPLRAALAQVRDDERVGLAIGTDEMVLLRGGDQVIERKVALPLRWLKGFVEVQSYQSRMERRATLGKIEALRFLRSLPRSTTNTPFWVVPAGPGLRLSQRDASGAVRVAGLERLRLLEELAPYAEQLAVFTDARGAASEWQLGFGPLRFSLTLSPDVWRGFSGEGQVLSDLAAADRARALDRVRERLAWQAELRAADFGDDNAHSLESIRHALALLGSRGLVGYDLARGAWFHRELPFDLASVEELHPRLAGARELVARGGVAVLQRSDNLLEAEVAGTAVVHRVRLAATGERCTCPWFAKHQGERGPCKHILAVQLQLENETAATHAAETR